MPVSAITTYKFDPRYMLPYSNNTATIEAEKKAAKIKADLSKNENSKPPITKVDEETSAFMIGGTILGLLALGIYWVKRRTPKVPKANDVVSNVIKKSKQHKIIQRNPDGSLFKISYFDNNNSLQKIKTYIDGKVASTSFYDKTGKKLKEVSHLTTSTNDPDAGTITTVFERITRTPDGKDNTRVLTKIIETPNEIITTDFTQKKIIIETITPKKNIKSVQTKIYKTLSGKTIKIQKFYVNGILAETINFDKTGKLKSVYKYDMNNKQLAQNYLAATFSTPVNDAKELEKFVGNPTKSYKLIEFKKYYKLKNSNERFYVLGKACKKTDENPSGFIIEKKREKDDSLIAKLVYDGNKKYFQDIIINE